MSPFLPLLDHALSYSCALASWCFQDYISEASQKCCGNVVCHSRGNTSSGFKGNCSLCALLVAPVLMELKDFCSNIRKRKPRPYSTLLQGSDSLRTLPLCDSRADNAAFVKCRLGSVCECMEVTRRHSVHHGAFAIPRYSSIPVQDADWTKNFATTLEQKGPKSLCDRQEQRVDDDC
jgi:hypothetical protein